MYPSILGMASMNKHIGSVFTKKNNNKRTLLDEIKYYGFYIWWREVEMIPLRIKSFFQRGYHGYSDQDTWDFDVYLAKVIVGGLKHLKKIQQGIPPEIYNKYKDRKNLTEKQKDKLALKEWQTTLDIIIRGFELVPEMFEMKVFKNKKLKESYEYEFERGLDMFKKYYFNLWD